MCQTIVILILALVFYFLSVNLIRKAKTEEQLEELSDLALAFSLEVTRMYSSLEDASLHEVLRVQARLSQTRVSLIKPDGTVVFDTEREPGQLESHRYRPEIDQALKGEKAWTIRQSDTLSKKLVYVAVPLEKDGQIIGVCRVSRYFDLAFMKYQGLRNILVFYVLSLILLGITLSYLFLRMNMKPLEELTILLDKAGSGEEVVVRHTLHRILEPLASSVEKITNELKKMSGLRAEAKEVLNGLITATEEGWLILDENEKILLVNPAFKKMFPQIEAGGEFFWETLRCPALIRNLEEARQKGEKYTAELEIGGRIYACRAIWLSGPKRFLVNFRDITEVKDLADRKKEFVANLVHELKTPLTAITGFIETLEEEQLNEEAKRYLEIIRRNSERLVRLVDDLSRLSELEEKGLPLEKEEINLAEVVNEIIGNYEKKAREKGLYLTLEKEGNPVLLADRFQMEQLVLNLVDNAVRYTEKGGVSVKLKEKNDGVLLEVSDTGLGIPEEHIPRIFERFYVVDKSRSRKTGGTGLGLAIVKHIVLLHEGKIEVKSAPGIGSTFTVWLPKRANSVD